MCIVLLFVFGLIDNISALLIDFSFVLLHWNRIHFFVDANFVFLHCSYVSFLICCLIYKFEKHVIRPSTVGVKGRCIVIRGLLLFSDTDIWGV